MTAEELGQVLRRYPEDVQASDGPERPTRASVGIGPGASPCPAGRDRTPPLGRSVCTAPKRGDWMIAEV